MGLPVEAKMFEVIKNVVPSTKAVHLTDGGCNWLDAVIQIQKRLEGEPKNALLAAFAAHPSLKILIVSNAKGSSLDPSSDQQNLLTAKVGIDATATLTKPRERFEIAKIPGEENINLSDYVSPSSG
jgi:3-polyprenyl-4-hydroxybenzoate decarboxylase